MEKLDLHKMTNEELLKAKKKLKKAKIASAVLIGFLAGILIFGLVSWILSPEKRLGFFIPMLIPVVFIYNMIKNRNANKDLENILKERKLD